MKKNILLLVLLLVLQVNAQKSKREEGIIIGIKGGLNISNFIGDATNQDIRTSIHLGLLTEIIVSDSFSIQPELLYSGQGSTYNGSIPGFQRTKLEYLTLPLLSKFKVYKSLSLEAGPQLGVLLSSKFKTNTSNNSIQGIKTIDFGLSAGLEYEFSNRLIIQGRYNLGLTDTGLNNDPNKRASNSVIQLSVGYLF